MNFKLRPIGINDNVAVSEIIQVVLAEFGYTGPGIASDDPELSNLYSFYQQPKSGYWVVEDLKTKQIVASGGYATLKGTNPDKKICELQKLYALPIARGKGLGKLILQSCIEQASKDSYKLMYLETLSALSGAVGMYEKFGFQYIPKHLGNTGHQERCSIYMTLDLKR